MSKYKYILFFIVALALLLSACSGNETLTPTGETMDCNVVSLLPPLDPTQQAIFPAVSDQDWIEGPDGAQVTIVEYSDFQ